MARNDAATPTAKSTTISMNVSASAQSASRIPPSIKEPAPDPMQQFMIARPSNYARRDVRRPAE